MIIDSHVHFPAGCEARPDIGSRLIRSAVPFGIGACVVSHIFGKDMGPDMRFPSSDGIREANLFAAAQCRLNPGRLFFMGYINPQNPDRTSEMDRCIALGACGFKLWVSLKDRHGSLENTAAVLRYAAALDKPVYLHVFNRTGGNLPGEIDMNEFRELAETVPECKMIAGHTGGNWRKSAEIISPCPENVWMETGGSNPDFGMVDGILKFCPPERLLYGSDAPGRAFYPQIWKILESSLDPAGRERVFCRNAMELLDLPQPPACPGPVLQRQEVPGQENIDYCCFCGHYPFESRPEVSPGRLETLLKQEKIECAFTADFSTIFTREPARANRRFLHECENLERVRPLAAADPNRAEILSEILSEPGWAGLWLSPAFHHWRLDDPAYGGFLRQCAKADKPVFINCGFYEPRFYHSKLSLREVSDAELITFLKSSPFEHCIIQGKIPPPEAKDLPDCRWCRIRLTDCPGTSPLGKLLVRGSEFPFRHLAETLNAARFPTADIDKF